MDSRALRSVARRPSSIEHRLAVIFLGLLLGFASVATSFGSVHAEAAHPLSTYNCTTNSGSGSGHCYAVNVWSGSVLGSRANLKVASLSCSGCTTSNKWHVSDEIWMIDTGTGTWAASNCYAGACWVESGTQSSAYSSSTCGSSMCYMWADSRPCGGGYNQHISTTRATNDLGALSALILQRTLNNGYHSCTPNTQWNAYASSSYYGTGVNGTSTYNPMYPNVIEIGLEVYGNTGESAARADWTSNEWVNTGNWAYQTGDGSKTIMAPTSGAWAVLPHSSSTGGDFYASCGC